jgi:tetratricopeptide (TPR) repeat protein
MSRPFQAIRIGDLPKAGRYWRAIRRPLGIRSFGVNAFVAEEPRDPIVNEHDETRTGHEELYVVLAGEATFTVAGEELVAPAGTLVFVRDPTANRAAVAREAGTAVLAVGARPGVVFEPSAWEVWADVHPLYEAGEYARAVELLVAELDRRPDEPGLLYNLACCESLGGDRQRALEHLEAAIDLDGSLRELARSDTDFDPIRDDTRFAGLVAG